MNKCLVFARNEAAIQRYFFLDCFGATRLAMTYLLLFFVEIFVQ